ncbi:MAG: hypothetical protein JWM19_854 [Actinomycetia bacterium]|nr:hypothetical protein [Actinomycetes bacterium]
MPIRKTGSVTGEVTGVEQEGALGAPVLASSRGWAAGPDDELLAAENEAADGADD